MLSRTRLMVALVAAPVCATALACHGGDGAKLTLRYHPPVGASYHYTLEQHNDMKFEGGPMADLPEQLMTLHMYFSQAVTGPTPLGVGVTVHFDSVTFDSPLMAAEAYRPAFARIRGLTNQMIYDDRLNVVRSGFTNTGATPSPLAEQVEKNVKGITVPLPERAVGVGDSWTTEVDLPMTQVMSASTPLKTKTRVTVKEIHAAGPDTTVLLGLETVYPTEPITVQSEDGPQIVKLSGRLSGEQLFSVTHGAVLRASAGGTIHIALSGGKEKGVTMSMRQAMSLLLRDGP